MATSPLYSGKLRHRVRIEQLVELRDTSGEVIQDPTTGEVQTGWQLVAKAWAGIEPLSAREFIQSATTQAQIVARITIRYREGLDAAMRIVHERKDKPSKVYNIGGLLSDIDSGVEYLTILCSLGVSDTGQ
jgi:SPP1 family predicted phage head-tail adaptor